MPSPNCGPASGVAILGWFALECLFEQENPIKTTLALMAILLCASASGQGDGPVPGNATLEEKVDWIVSELGHSQDGLTVRDSIGVTDLVVFGIFGIVLLALVVYIVRIRIILAKVEGRIDAAGDNEPMAPY